MIQSTCMSNKQGRADRILMKDEVCIDEYGIDVLERQTEQTKPISTMFL